MFKTVFTNIYKDMDIFKHYDIDIEDIQNTFTKFKNKLQNLEIINEGDKIYFDESNKIQITPSSYIQCAVRWYNSYNRHEIFALLHGLINEYFQFCDMLTYYKQHIYNNKNNYLFNKIYNETYNYLSKLIISIEILKNTYYNDFTIQKKFDDLKNLISNKLLMKTAFSK